MAPISDAGVKYVTHGAEGNVPADTTPKAGRSKLSELNAKALQVRCAPPCLRRASAVLALR